MGKKGHSRTFAPVVDLTWTGNPNLDFTRQDLLAAQVINMGVRSYQSPAFELQPHNFPPPALEHPPSKSKLLPISQLAKKVAVNSSRVLLFPPQKCDLSSDFAGIRYSTQPGKPYWITSIAHAHGDAISITSSIPKASFPVKFEDLYGFTAEGNIDDANVLNEVRERVRRQDRIWWELEASKGVNWYLFQPQISWSADGIRVSSLGLSKLANAITLNRLIRKGIPPGLRPNLWLWVSGAAKKRSTVPESYYDDLIRATQGKVTPATRQIDHDLPRTFPNHPWLDSLEGQASLRRVLVGYSFRDSDVGYCQGLNYVAALLLLVMNTEEDAFWMLAVLLENVLVRDCYTGNLSGCHVEQRVFRDLLAKKCPRISVHLNAIGFDVSLVATEWFLCLFAKRLPSETTLRVWDVLFKEGAKVLFHVALAIFKMNEEEILNANQIGEVIHILQRTIHHLYDPDELLRVAFDKIGSMTTNTITKERKKQEPAVMAELHQRLRRLNMLKTNQ
ncbi:TBC1 domain family member 2A-like [Zingiber officinale]|uniref:TBC1 domain family member 2A-like n=2 Tax=Zingiber officinale TaxID=94328 RepID=UPI001C4CAB3D|nr:TBC1 domain family member 2A-like [Zingiber officinale]